MARRGLPDAVQEQVIEALRWTGARVVDTSNVPVALPELEGFPDLTIIEPRGLTLVGTFDAVKVRELLRPVPGVVVWPGAVLLAEVKTPTGKIRSDQLAWWSEAGLHPVVLRNEADAVSLVGREWK